MAKKLSMEERLRQKERAGSDQQESVVHKDKPKREQANVSYEKQAKREAFNLDKREKAINESKESESSTNNTKHFNTSEVEKDTKESKLNKSTFTENLTSDKIVDFIREGKGKYLIGLGIFILLLAYIFGLFIGLVSDKRQATANPLKAIYYSLTTGAFFTFIVVIIIVIALIALFTTILGKTKKDTDREFGNSDALGSGGIATEDDKEKLLIRTKTLEEQPYIVFGKEIETGLWVGLNPDIDINHNTSVCGPQQSGKSFKFVKNNLIQLAKNKQSIIISDPKGEMYRDMSQYFVEEGYVVKQLNVNDLYSSDSWNILKDVNEDNIDQFARTFVENLSDGKEEETFIDMKFSLFKALCLYVLYEDKDLDEDERTLGRVYEMLATMGSEQELDDLFLSLSNSSKAKQTYINWSLGGRLKTNSLATLAAKLQIFQRQALKEVTGTTDIDILLPSKQKCAYFIILDDQNTTYSCIVSVFIKLIIEKAVWYAKRQKTGKTDLRIHFMLDEFPTVGRIPDFKTGLGTWRGYGIDITAIYQNIPQLMNRYPDNVWNEILGACAIQVCLGAYEDGDITAEHFAKMGGVGTIVVDSERRQHNNLSILDTKAYTQVAKTESLQQAQAIYSSEVKDLILNNEMLVTIGGSKPFKFKKVGFNENKYYNTPQKPTYENVPIWMLKLKDKTDFRTEYGGLFKLGRIEDLPLHVINRIDKWRDEYFRGTGAFISDETLPITYATSIDATENIKKLNRKQGASLLNYLKQLVSTSMNEFTSTTYIDVSKTITEENNASVINEVPFTRKTEPDDLEFQSKNTSVKDEATVQPAKREAPAKQAKSSNDNLEQQDEISKNKIETIESGDDVTRILSTNGKTFVKRETEDHVTETQKKANNSTKPIKFNVTFTKKN